MVCNSSTSARRLGIPCPRILTYMCCGPTRQKPSTNIPLNFIQRVGPSYLHHLLLWLPHGPQLRPCVSTSHPAGMQLLGRPAQRKQAGRQKRNQNSVMSATLCLILFPCKQELRILYNCLLGWLHCTVVYSRQSPIHHSVTRQVGIGIGRSSCSLCCDRCLCCS